MTQEDSPKHDSFSTHKKIGTKLESSWSSFQMSFIDWDRDFVPEFLWVDYLAQEYSEYNWIGIYNDFIDTLESYFDANDFYLTGTISDFGRVPEDARDSILHEEQKKVGLLFESVIGGLLLYYPECPAAWLMSGNATGKKKSFEFEMGKLKHALIRLSQAKDKYCSQLRMMPLIRTLKHGKLSIPRDAEIVELLPRYPHDLSEDEQALVEATVRPMVNMILGGTVEEKDRHITSDWCQYFWNHNYDISPCEESEVVPKPVKPEVIEMLEEIPSACEHVVEALDEYMDLLRSRYQFDIYEPLKDEVVLGLFARISRLTSALLSDLKYLEMDISRIFLRCIVDSCITLLYLLEKDETALYQAFIDYGLGKEKLLLLHMRDSYEGGLGPSGESAEQISRSIGNDFMIETLDIELGSWSKLDTRSMAIQSGCEDLYRLVFDPTSSDIHGTWTSIRNTNLTRCMNPMHRYHRLPVVTQPPLFMEPLSLVVTIFKRAVDKCIVNCDFPAFEHDLGGIDAILQRLVN